MRRLVDLAMARLVAHVASLPDQPDGLDGGAALARALAEPMPEAGAPYEELPAAVPARRAEELNVLAGGRSDFPIDNSAWRPYIPFGLTVRV